MEINILENFSTDVEDMVTQQGVILIVDDSEINRSLLYNILTPKYKIIEAENGLQALKLLRKYFYMISAVLLDIDMPVMNGIELLRHKMIDNSICSIPTIVLSSENKDLMETVVLALNAEVFLEKPYNKTNILGYLEHKGLSYS